MPLVLRHGARVFENEEIAKLMNEYFVNVKVDREERPDVDKVYDLCAGDDGRGLAHERLSHA